MSREELERLVGDAEVSASVRDDLRRCRSRDELVLAARRLGYRLTSQDLQRAWWEESLAQRASRNANPESSGPEVLHHV